MGTQGLSQCHVLNLVCSLTSIPLGNFVQWVLQGTWLLPFGNIQVLCLRTTGSLQASGIIQQQADASWWASLQSTFTFVCHQSQQCQRVHPQSAPDPFCGQACCVIGSLFLPTVSLRLRDGCFLDCLPVCAPLPRPEDAQVCVCLQAAATVLLALCPGRWPVVTT